eukprot:scaffold111510_cov97-Phaeocystis_antarctica.AAC.1
MNKRSRRWWRCEAAPGGAVALCPDEGEAAPAGGGVLFPDEGEAAPGGAFLFPVEQAKPPLVAPSSSASMSR